MNKAEIIEFIKSERIHFGEYASLSKEHDRNGSEYLLTDLLLKFQSKLANEVQQPTEAHCHIGGVSDSAFNIGDVVCKNDGIPYVIREIDGDDIIADGNGKTGHPLDVGDVSHYR